MMQKNKTVLLLIIFGLIMACRHSYNPYDHPYIAPLIAENSLQCSSNFEMLDYQCIHDQLKFNSSEFWNCETRITEAAVMRIQGLRSGCEQFFLYRQENMDDHQTRRVFGICEEIEKFEHDRSMEIALSGFTCFDEIIRAGGWLFKEQVLDALDVCNVCEVQNGTR